MNSKEKLITSLINCWILSEEHILRKYGGYTFRFSDILLRANNSGKDLFDISDEEWIEMFNNYPEENKASDNVKYVIKKVEDIIEQEKTINELKKIISYVHCSNCGNEVGNNYKLIQDTLHCEKCFDYIIKKEEHKKQEEIERLEKRLKELKGE